MLESRTYSPLTKLFLFGFAAYRLQKIGLSNHTFDQSCILLQWNKVGRVYNHDIPFLHG